jgi:glycosyltransferase involved in cell wall biosynthesis
VPYFATDLPNCRSIYRKLKHMRILGFGYDTDLLLPEDDANEGQYRQRRYCVLLGQEKVIVVLSSGSVKHRERSLAGGRVVAVSASAKSKMQQICLAYRHGVDIGRRFRPDIVEYQDPQLAGLVAFLTARTLHVPLVGGLFNDFLDNPIWLGGSIRRYLYNWVGKFVLSRSVCVRCDSVDTMRALNDKGYTQVRYVPFFVPGLEDFSVSDAVQHARLIRWQDDPVILCVARLSREKNVALLLQAFGQTYAVSQRGRLLVAGSGPMQDELKSLAVKLGISRRVTWLGTVDYTALPRHYREANLFALSSDSETSARVLTLAQASRLPTVTTDTSGSRDIVNDGQTGYVTPVRDLSAFAQALDSLFNDEAVYQHMLESGEYQALERHGERVITTELREFYRGLPLVSAEH